MKQSTKRKIQKIGRQYGPEIALVIGALAGVVALWALNNLLRAIAHL